MQEPRYRGTLGINNRSLRDAFNIVMTLLLLISVVYYYDDNDAQYYFRLKTVWIHSDKFV